MSKWESYNGKEDIIAVTSCVRMFRNINNINFLSKLNEKKCDDIINNVKEVFNSTDELESFKYYRSMENTMDTVESYFQKYLVGKGVISNYNNTAFFVNDDEDASVCVNEIDHIRITGKADGFNLKEAYDKCNNIDSLMESKLDYAFDENIGYLTARIKDAGTGIKGIVIVHIPMIILNDSLPKIKQHLNDFGISINPLYKDKDKSMGAYYVISTEITTGMTEEEILMDLEEEVFKVMSSEYALREKAKQNLNNLLLDKIYRAMALIQNSMIIPVEEGINLISYVRLGVEMSIIKDIDIKELDKLLIAIQSDNIKARFQQKLNDDEINLERARLLKEKLS